MPTVLLRTGMWRGAPLLTGSAWQVLHEAARVLGLRADPYAVGLAAEVAVTLLDGVGELGARLAERQAGAPGVDGPVVVLDSGRLPELTAYLSGQPDLSVLAGEPSLRGLGLLDVVSTMDRLRSPGGCPWDAEQTHASLRPYLLEEAQEAVEAIDSGDRTHLAEELGDVLLQVVFHARVGQEDPREPFDIDDVAAGLVAKLVRRHPHVFGDAVAKTPAEVATNWEQIKAAERRGRVE
ncbi:MAG: MazG family protein [Dermatophilaceae bacterium]